MNSIPKDPNMLYSYINMMLRDEFDTLEEFCAAKDVSPEQITATITEAVRSSDPGNAGRIRVQL